MPNVQRTVSTLLYIGVRLDVAGREYTDDDVVARTTFVAATDRVFAIIVIPANAVTLTVAMITDTRYNTTYCGVVDEYSVALEAMATEFTGELARITAEGLPTHNETHYTGGSDALAPDDIDAISFVAQTLSEAQKAQARTNISAAALLAADTTIYVATTGSDVTGDGTVGTPYATITKAVSVIPKCLGGFTATISVAAGTYTDTPLFTGFYAGIITLAFNGATTINGQLKFTANKCQILSTGNVAITCNVSAQGCIQVEDSYVRFNQDCALTNSASDGRGASVISGSTVILADSASSSVITVSVGAAGNAFLAATLSNLYVRGTAGTVYGGFVANAAVIYVGSNGMTTTVKVAKSNGGMVKTGSGADLT
ncbi:MAG: hypothetical protein ABFC31_07105 [Clostridiaceae bacterium]